MQHSSHQPEAMCFPKEEHLTQPRGICIITCLLLKASEHILTWDLCNTVYDLCIFVTITFVYILVKILEFFLFLKHFFSISTLISFIFLPFSLLFPFFFFFHHCQLFKDTKYIKYLGRVACLCQGTAEQEHWGKGGE